MKNLKRWLTWLLLVSVFSVACVFLSQWQFNRRAEAVAKIQLVERNYDQSPVSIDLVSQPSAFQQKNEWRPVSLRGKFLVELAVLVRNRPYNGSPGFLQVIPFLLEEGQIVAVETGWLPTGSDNEAPKQIPLPSEEVQQIIGRVRAAEPTLNRDAPAGQIATINVDSLVAKEKITGEVYRASYVRLADSYSNQQFPKVLGKPELSEGNHLSYALQWILFALMAFGALWWAIRQEAIARRLANDPTFQPKVRKKIGDDDKAAEDAAL
jgi:cytochrome oxidase assembly protein ShyY1